MPDPIVRPATPAPLLTRPGAQTAPSNPPAPDAPAVGLAGDKLSLTPADPYKGRPRLKEAADAEWNRLVKAADLTAGAGELPWEVFARQAKLADLTPADLQSLRKGAQPQPLTRAEFDTHFDKVVGVKSSYRMVTRNPRDVHQPFARDLVEAKDKLEKNTGAESLAIARLQPAQAEAYLRVRAQIAKDPVAQQTLQAMLLAGRLTGGNPNTRGDDILTALDRFAVQEVKPPLDRDALLGDVIQEIADPASITQGDRSVCAASTVQVVLAMDRPAEYVRLVAGLAAPSGKVLMANGEILEREPGTEEPDNSKRSAPTRLFVSAIMEFGNGELDYDNTGANAAYTLEYFKRNPDKLGRTSIPQGFNSDGTAGLTRSQIKKLVEALSGRKASVVDATAESRPILASTVKNAIAAGKVVSVGVAWGERNAQGEPAGRHSVVVTAWAKGEVTYINPWGKVETMTEEEFRSRLTRASFVDHQY